MFPKAVDAVKDIRSSEMAKTLRGEAPTETLQTRIGRGIEALLNSPEGQDFSPQERDAMRQANRSQEFQKEVPKVIREIAPAKQEIQKGQIEAKKNDFDPMKQTFVSQDVKPTVEKAKEATKATIGTMKRIPDVISGIFQSAFPVEKKYGMEPSAQVIRGIHETEGEILKFDNTQSKTFDKNFAQLEDYFNKYTPDELNNFNLARGRGKGLTPESLTMQEEAFQKLTPEQRDMAKAVREASDYVFNYAAKNGIDMNYFEDYFYGTFKDKTAEQKAAIQNFKEYWSSSLRYTKKKNIPTIADAEAFGLELKDQNPITNIKKELAAVGYHVGLKNIHDYNVETNAPYMAYSQGLKKDIVDMQTELADLKSKNPQSQEQKEKLSLAMSDLDDEAKGVNKRMGQIEQEIKQGGDADKLLNELKDSQGKLDVIAKKKKTLRESSEATHLARMFDIQNRLDKINVNDEILNRDAPPEWQKVNDHIFRGYLFDPQYARYVNNMISTNKLSSHWALSGLRSMTYGFQQAKFIGSMFHMANMVKHSIAANVGGIANPKGITDFVSGFKKVDMTTPEYVDYAKLGGGYKYSLEANAESAMNRVVDRFKNGNYTGAILRLPVGVAGKLLSSKYIPLSPGSIKWMFEDFIPTLKYNRFVDDVQAREKQLNRPLTDGEKIQTIRTIQNFYGEMNERLFGRSGTVTSLMRLAFMAPGYGEGNLRTLVSSMDAKGLLKEGSEARKNLQYVVNSLVATATLATVGMLAMTGKAPDPPQSMNDLRDLFKIKTGKKDKNDNDTFIDLMTFDKDYWMLYGNALTGSPEKIPGDVMTRVSGATSPGYHMLTDLSTLLQGRMVYDYRGKPLYYPTDDMQTKFVKMSKHFIQEVEPIAMSTYSQASTRGESFGQSLGSMIMGFRPTTSEHAREINTLKNKLRNQKAMETDERSKARMRFTDAIKAGDATKEDFEAAKTTGVLDENYDPTKSTTEDLQTSSDERLFKTFTPKEALSMWNQMRGRDKPLIAEIFARKISDATAESLGITDDEQDKLIDSAYAIADKAPEKPDMLEKFEDLRDKVMQPEGVKK